MARKCIRKTFASFMSKQLVRHCSQRQGNPGRDRGRLNYEFAMFRDRGAVEVPEHRGDTSTLAGRRRRHPPGRF